MEESGENKEKEENNEATIEPNQEDEHSENDKDSREKTESKEEQKHNDDDKEEDINEGQGQSETDIEVDDQLQNQGNNTKGSKIRDNNMVKTKKRVVFMLSKRVVKKKRNKVTMKNQ